MKAAAKRSKIKFNKQMTVTTNSKKLRKKETKSERRLHLEGSTVHRISVQDWIKLKSQLIQLSREEFATFLGFENMNVLDEKLAVAVQNTVKFQEQVRSRIRGVPAPSFRGAKNFGSKLMDNKLVIPEEFLSKLNLSKDQEIELIPGKDEYLFYARVKKR